MPRGCVRRRLVESFPMAAAPGSKLGRSSPVGMCRGPVGMCRGPVGMCRGPRPSACAEDPSACAEDPSACAEDDGVKEGTAARPAARRSVWDVLQANRHGRTIVISSHFMDEAERHFLSFGGTSFSAAFSFFSVHADGECRDLRTGFEGRAHRRDGDQMRQLGLQIDGKPVGGSPSACSEILLLLLYLLPVGGSPSACSEIFVTKGRHSRRGTGRQGRRHAVPTHMPASMPAARVCTHVVTQARSGVLLWFITVSQITVSSIFGNFSGACRRRTPRARSNPRLFRCYPPIRSSPRRSPSACPEKSPKIERRVSCCGSPLFLKSR